MKINQAYSALGGAFEYLNKDCGYDKWSQYLIEKLAKNGAGGCGADIGCGNGFFTRALCKAGYSVTGIDISPQMLSAALQLALSEGIKTEFLLGDITKLNLNFKPDFITAINDCINYVPKDKLSSAFKRVNKNLKKGGLFIFDISSASKLRHIVGSNLFAEDTDELTYLWFNSLNEDSVDMDITVFTRRPDGLYERADERHTQYVYEEDEIASALQQAGFSVETEGHLGGGKEERINFICRKYE